MKLETIKIYGVNTILAMQPSAVKVHRKITIDTYANLQETLKTLIMTESFFMPIF